MRYMTEMPRAEGQFLAGPWGPLASLPGTATWAAGVLVLDEPAFARLAHLGTFGDHEGAVTWDGDVPVVHAGGRAYELEPAEGEGSHRAGRMAG